MAPASGEEEMDRMEQPLFKPFRALGYITDDVPFAVGRRGKETYVTVSVGKAWQVYNCSKLGLVLVGPQMKQSIRALACKGDLTFAAAGSDVAVCKRVHSVGVCRGRPGAGAVKALLVIGEQLLVLHAGGVLAVWGIGQYDKAQSEIVFGAGFAPTCLAHPDTYVNKVLVGSEGGSMQLWNWVTGTCLYTFKGWGCGIRVLASSPALDVVGVGLADGCAVLHNLRFDEEVASFENASGAGLAASGMLGGGAGMARTAGGGGGAVTALSFTTGSGAPLLAAGGGAGAVTVWDLEGRKLHTVIKDAHDARLLCLHFFAGEPRLMSSGADNSLKQWLFDNADGTGRLLRFRSGHAAPPSVVAHYGEGLRLLSAGADRAFRVFSTIQDQQSRELSQGHIGRKAKRLKVKEAELKLNRVVGLDACEVRERDWCNVVTAHDGDVSAYTWRLANFTIGEHSLRPPPPPHPEARTAPIAACPASAACQAPPAPVTSVCLSRCGNFGVVGSASGRLDRYNMQSGIHRGTYWRVEGEVPGEKQKAKSGPPVPGGGVPVLAAHDGAILGVAVDACNRLLVSASHDGQLRIWDFKAQRLQADVQLGAPAVKLSLHASSALAAVALAGSNAIHMYDIEAPRLVRRFKGHTDRVTGLQLSQDSRWLLSSSMDGSLRVWDVPVSNCLQVLQLGAPITALSLSPAQDMLATAHVNRRGIYLWSNQAVFGDPSKIAAAVPGGVVHVELPSVTTGHDRNRSVSHNGVPEEGHDPESDLEMDDEGSDAGSEDEDAEDEESAAARRSRAAAAAAAAASGGDEDGMSHGNGGTAGYERRDSHSGGPLPIEPDLVTLSLLPRAQWESLPQLELIKARNKPIAPPTKPAAAPFFLPTIPGLTAEPVFDLSASDPSSSDAFFKGGAAGDAGPGESAAGSEDQGELHGEAADAAQCKVGPGHGSKKLKRQAKQAAAAESGSRIHHATAGAVHTTPASDFVRLLRRCGQAAGAGGGGGSAAAVAGKEAGGGGATVGAWSPFVAHLRTLAPAVVDRELRSMELLEGADEAEVKDVALLLQCLASMVAAGTDFEFGQALLQLTLQVHGDAIMQYPELRDAASDIHGQLRRTWGRLDPLLQHVRCMVAYFGSFQG